MNRFDNLEMVKLAAEARRAGASEKSIGIAIDHDCNLHSGMGKRSAAMAVKATLCTAQSEQTSARRLGIQMDRDVAEAVAKSKNAEARKEARRVERSERVAPPDRLDELTASMRAIFQADRRKAEMASAVEEGVRRALKTHKLQDQSPRKTDEDDLDEEDEEEQEGESEEKAPRKQRVEAARYVNALSGKPEPPRFQIGAHISRNPSADGIAGYTAGSRVRGGFHAPMPISSPPGRSPFVNGLRREDT